MFLLSTYEEVKQLCTKVFVCCLETIILSTFKQNKGSRAHYIHFASFCAVLATTIALYEYHSLSPTFSCESGFYQSVIPEKRLMERNMFLPLSQLPCKTITCRVYLLCRELEVTTDNISTTTVNYTLFKL